MSLISIIIALLLPWLALLLRGRILQGILCLILQLTVIGWLPAAVWALMVIMKEERAG